MSRENLNINNETRLIENEPKIETKIILEFMRHGEKEIDPNTSDIDPSKSDKEICLTPKGREQVNVKGRKINSNARISVALGSSRRRAKETSARVMLANENMPENASLEEINDMIDKKFQNEQMLDRDYNYGIKSKKIIEDKRLDFNAYGPVGKEEHQAMFRGEYFQYLVKESDKRAVELSDKESTTYLRYAGNISEILQRYIKIGNNFNKLVSKASENEREKYSNRLERYLGSHQGVLEPFVLKILEKTQGKEKRDEYIEAVGSGFKETQGFRVEIINNSEDQKIVLTYEVPNNNGDDPEKETLEIDKKLIEEIIEERKKFEEEVERSVKK